MSAAPPSGQDGVEDWAGFVLLIAPMPGLETDAAQLCRQAADHVADDPTIGETVVVALGPEVGGDRPGQRTAVARALAAAATRPGYLFAPTVVLGILLLGPERQRTAQIAEWLADTQVLQPFRIHQFSMSEDTGAVTVTEVLTTVDRLRGQYDQWPTASLTEDQFLAAMNRRPAPSAPAVESAPAAPAVPVPAVPSAAAARVEPAPAALAVPVPAVPSAAAARVVPAATAAAPAPWTADEHEPAGEYESTRVYRAASGHPPHQQPVVRAPSQARRVVWSGAIDKVRGLLPQQAPTEPESMDRLAARSGDVSLVYLVLAPDLSPVPRSTRNRRRDLGLEVDAAFARRKGEGATPFQMSLLAGDRRITRQNALQSAGGLSKGQLPKVGVGYFDLAACVNDVLVTRERDIASLRRRSTAVTGTYVVLLSTHAPLADIDAVERFEELCEHAWVAWILVDADTSLLSEEFTSVERATILEDHPDVVNALMAALAADEEQQQSRDRTGSRRPENAAENSADRVRGTAGA